MAAPLHALAARHLGSARRALVRLLPAASLLALVACAGPQLPTPPPASTPPAQEPVFDPAAAATDDPSLLIVAVGNDLTQAAQLAASYGLQQLKAWTVATLDWRCMLLKPPPGSDSAALLSRLKADPRVRLAQSLNSFQTLASSPAPGSHTAGNTTSAPASTAASNQRYNDPYLPLQTGFAAIDAAGAQRTSQGQGVTIAVIDTGIDASHPELQGRVLQARDFVGRAGIDERHGTEVAGVIAAAANNGIGIVGVAPAVRLVAIRSCWGVAPGEPARCNSFTIAQGFSAAMAAGADIINLSLGGPRDGLLEQLAQQAMERGIVVVGALPLSGRRDGFPSALPGVLVASANDAAASGSGGEVLRAPGRSILTLAPGGGYDYASGSSLATAHVSGAVALLRAMDPRLDGPRAARLLGGGSVIDACRALQRLVAQAGPVCTPVR